MTTAQCPVCGAESVDSLLCHADTSRLEQALAEVPGLVAELDIALSKQAKIGTPGKSGTGWAREKLSMNVGASIAAGALTNVLTTWARDVTNGHLPFSPDHYTHASIPAARILMDRVGLIRRHPAVDELVDEILDAVAQARRAIDRPADRVYLGQCLVETPDPEGRQVTCLADLHARPGASHAKCGACGITHEVLERRLSLLEQASDLLFTVIEAARLIGSYGDLQIRESTIRNYVSSGQIAYHGKVSGSSVIRLGDLLTVIAAHAAKPNGRKLVKMSTSRVGS